MPLEQSAPKKTFFPQSSGRISAWSMVSAFRLRLGAGCGCGRTVAGLVGTGGASRFRLASAASRLPRSTRPRFLRESRLPVLNGLLARHTVSLPSHIRASKCWVVYPTTADNYFAPKPGTMPPTQPVLEGAVVYTTAADNSRRSISHTLSRVTSGGSATYLLAVFERIACKEARFTMASS